MTDVERPDRNDQVVTAVLSASQALVAVSARSLAEFEDRLTMAQFRTLVVLAEDRSTNLHRLEERLGIAAATALRTVEHLIEDGLATRDEHANDRHEVILVLTREGRRVVDAVTARRRLEVARIVAGMSTTNTRQLIAAFQAFAASVGEPTPRGAPPSSLGW